MEEQEEIAVIFNQLTESVRKYDGIACNIKIYLGKSSLMWFLYILKLRGEAITKKESSVLYHLILEILKMLMVSNK